MFSEKRGEVLQRVDERRALVEGEIAEQLRELLAATGPQLIDQVGASRCD